MTCIAQIVLVIVTLISGLGVSANAIAYKGRVIEAETGRPMEDVWVIGRWEVGGGFVHGGSGCLLAITKSDREGGFTLESREGFLRSIWPLRARPAIVFYKTGFAENRKLSKELYDLYVIQLDDVPIESRLDKLIATLAYTDCGLKHTYDHRDALRPLYQQVDSEARAIASTPFQRQALEAVNRFLAGLDLTPDRW